jgi:hypothetical protein
MTMKTRLLMYLLTCCAFCHAGLAQEAEKIRVKGRVLDERTNEPMAFVNIGLLGTTLGVASDIDGYFELAVAPRYADHVTRFSAVGYASHDARFRELVGKEGTVIRMSPVAYSLGDVEVVGSIDVIRRLLERVVKEIPANYIPRPYNYEGYFARATTAGGDKKEAIISLYDRRGYARGDVAGTFADLHYTLTQVRREKAATSPADGMIFFDDVLTADVVRHTRNPLDLDRYRDFTFKDQGKTLYEGDTVQVIGFTCTRPSLSTTGDAAALAQEGEIYVKLKDLAVIKYVSRLTSLHYNPAGRDLVVPEGTAKEPCRVTTVTNYKKVSSYYFLGGVSVVVAKGDGTGETMVYHTTGVRVDDPRPVEGRLYYEELDTDYRFWDRYTLSLDEND